MSLVEIKIRNEEEGEKKKSGLVGENKNVMNLTFYLNVMRKNFCNITHCVLYF